MGRTFDLLLPKRAGETSPGIEFTDSPKNYVRRTGTLEETMWAMMPQNSPWEATPPTTGRVPSAA